MDSRRHSAITGSVAVINPWVGGRVTARARFVEATHVKLDTGKQILLAWRTQDFPADAPDSHVEIQLQPAAGGTKVSISHTQIPAGHSAAAREIWRTSYLDPMKRYFGKSGGMEAAHRAAARAGQMPTADMLGMRRARTPIT
ncbi:MAG: SRPBCC domain-containing protein, partial [Myxococcales bacterium]|nr:SRPBCC domain-containing protein [Myxococcales bacterium]